MEKYGIHQLTIPLPFWNDNVHCYLGQQKDGKWTIIDTGLNNNKTKETWTKALNKYNINPKTDIEKILITHHHPDHFEYSNELQSLTESDVYMGENEHKLSLNILTEEEKEVFYLESGMPLKLIKQLQSVNESSSQLPEKIKYIKNGDTYMIGELLFEALQMPGHSEEHICFYNKEEEVLITGDHLTREVIPYISYHGIGDKNPLKTYINTLKNMQSMDISLILPGHGPIFRDAQERIKELLVYFKNRLNQVREMIKISTAYEVSRTLYPKLDTTFDQWVALGEVNAYLAYLLDRKEVIREIRKGKAKYILT